jgi:hypothetical protein
MALPDSCELTTTHLVFWELADERQLADVDRLYEYCCTVACTNGLRPLGMVEVTAHSWPALGTGEVLRWGQRTVAADDAGSYARQGMVLCQLRLPVRPMAAAR